MYNNHINIVVVTHKMDFYSALAAGLRNAGIKGVFSHAGNLKSAGQGLVKNTNCVLIIDLDIPGLGKIHDYLQQLISGYLLLVILTATAKESASGHLKPPVKDFVVKPLINSGFSKENYYKNIFSRIQSFAVKQPVLDRSDIIKPLDENQKIIVIASSTGGTEALDTIFRSLPGDVPPILVVQHMASGFTQLFAGRLDKVCKPNIKEAVNNDILKIGQILIAPSGQHMKLTRRGGRLMVECFYGPKVHGVIPAADLLFESVASIMQRNAVGVVLTGMGSDGAQGLMQMRRMGADTLGQDQATSVIYGMPKAAYDMGAVGRQLPLKQIGPAMLLLARK